ncbi:MAG: DUF5360 family protein [Bacillota bacterium]|nr:DUF5360 family protein [Bacillota bacterium]
MTDRNFKILRVFMLLNDIFFILYWSVTVMHLIPEEFLYKDYNNPILVTWNWSFFALDMFISLTGITSIILNKLKIEIWKQLTVISLTLTFCSGLQAISFWAIQQDFDLVWWIPNLFLLVYPIVFMFKYFSNERVKAGKV